MLYAARCLEQTDFRILEQIGRRRRVIAEALAHDQPWTNSLSRLMMQRTLQGATGIGDTPARDADAAGYRAALSRVAAVAQQRGAPTNLGNATARVAAFLRQRDLGSQTRSRRPLLDRDLLGHLHADVCGLAPWEGPVSLRAGAVAPSASGLAAYDQPGAPVSELSSIVDEVVASVARAEEAVIASSLAYLNLRVAQPYPEGNRRMALAVNTLVLSGIPVGLLTVPVPFSGIEEAVARRAGDFEESVAMLGGDGWHPDRDASDWVRLCLRTHAIQGQVMVQRLVESEQAWYRAVGLGADEVETRILLEAMIGHELTIPLLVAVTGADVATIESALIALERRGLLICINDPHQGRACLPGMPLQNLRSAMAGTRPAVIDPYPELHETIRGF